MSTRYESSRSKSTEDDLNKQLKDEENKTLIAYFPIRV